MKLAAVDIGEREVREPRVAVGSAQLQITPDANPSSSPPEKGDVKSKIPPASFEVAMVVPPLRFHIIAREQVARQS
jgi:hypothetical protein